MMTGPESVNAADEGARGTIFISYSKDDEEWCKRVEAFLKTLERWGDAEVWVDKRIDSGADWYDEIRAAIDRSAVAVLLLSKDFLRTDFIAKQEIPELLRRREQLDMKLIPLLIHDCPWGAVRWLRKLNIVPDKATPLATFDESWQNTYLSRMTEEIGEFLEAWPDVNVDVATPPAPRAVTVPSAPTATAPAPDGRSSWQIAEAESGLFGRLNAYIRGIRLSGLSRAVRIPGLGLPTVLFPRSTAPSPGSGSAPAPVRVTAPAVPEPRLQVQTTVDIAHLPETSATLFGRDAELDALDADWASPDTGVVAFVAAGGTGKSALLNRWLQELQADGWRGARRVFGWSFYSQGARDQAASGDLFIDTALRFFGDPDPTLGSAWERGERLAGLVVEQRSLLVLDGLEPLQSAQAFDRGQLHDPGVQTLLRRLAAASRRVGDKGDGSGLCLISTREPLPDLDGRAGFHTVDLATITPQDGRALLRSQGVVGSDAQLEDLVREFGPSALVVTLLGSLLYRQPGHAAAAAAALPPGSDPLTQVLAGLEGLIGEGPALDLLQAQGLFDRPAPVAQVAAALGVERPDPAAVARLRELRLLAPPGDHRADLIEAHPLVREHYARQLRELAPERFRDGHRHLYEYLRETTEHRPDTLAGLQPLYQAVAHGCLAGLHPRACEEIYIDRILRGTGENGFYSRRKIGAMGADLGAVASFFERPWSKPSPKLLARAQGWLLNQAAEGLRALGRLDEALEPMRAGLERSIGQHDWANAAIDAGNLSQLELALGELSAALADADRAVVFADRGGDGFERVAARASHADVLNQAGRREPAVSLFAVAEGLQVRQQPRRPRLYSLRGFHYCDCLLSDAESKAWRRMLDPAQTGAKFAESELVICDQVTERAKEMLSWDQSSGRLLDKGLDPLTLGRAALYRALLSTHGAGRWLSADAAVELPQVVFDRLMAAVEGLRQAGATDHLPRGLLTRAWQRRLSGDVQGAAADLDEASEIAERGPMPLFQADILLTRARLFGLDADAGAYPWESAQADLIEARRLIERHGYHRRDQELADAEAALGV